MDKSPLAKPRFAILAVSLLLLTILALVTLEMIRLLRQGWSSWMLGSARPLAIFVFTVLALYLLNGRSEKVANWLQRYKLSLLFPPLEELIENQKRHLARRMVTERMDVTLEFYRLVVQDRPVEPPAAATQTGWRAWLARLWRRRRPAETKPLPNCRALVAERMPLLALDEEARIGHCAEQLLHCGVATTSGRQLTASQLCLLYREQHGLETALLFAGVSALRQQSPELAQILLESGRLPEQRLDRPFPTAIVAAVLQEMRDFKLAELQAKLQQRQQQIAGYQKVVDKMFHTLLYFGLTVPDDAYDELVDNAPEGTDPDEMITHCTRSAAACLPQGADLLELLYRERHKLSLPAGWTSLIPELAEVLSGHPNLPLKEPVQEAQAGEAPYHDGPHPFCQDEICRALKQLPDFTLEGLVKCLLANELKRREGLAILRRMEYTLNYYQLFRGLDEASKRATEQSQLIPSTQPNGHWFFTEDFRQDYLSRLPDQFDVTAYASCCAQTVADHLEPASPLPSAGDLVELVYRERNGEGTAVFWSQRRQQLRPGLAQLLVESGKLPDPDLAFPYQVASLEEILAPHEDYSLNLIRDEIDHLGLLWRLAEKYRDFLRLNEIETWRLQPADLLQLAGPLPAERSRLPQLLDRTLDVLLWSGRKSIRDSFADIKEDMARESEQADIGGLSDEEVLAAVDGLEESFCRVSLAIFLSGEPDNRSQELLRRVCLAMGNDAHAIRTSLAFVDLTADLEGRQQAEDKDFVTIRALIKNWYQRDQHLRDNFKGYDKEIATLKQVFHSGEWLTRLWKTLTQTLRQLSDASAPVMALVENRRQLHEALKRVFMQLDVRTVERFLEARTVVAYLLAFDSTRGSLAGLIDTFMLRPADIAAEKNDNRRQELWARYQQLQTLGVHLQDDQGRWLYNFRPYTFNTRIGVLPAGWTLSRFHRLLSADMMAVTAAGPATKRILAPDNEWTDEIDLEATEVILHRFGLRNHYALNLASRSEKAVQNMLGLFATQIEFNDLVATVSYEHLDLAAVAEAINTGSIAELGRDAEMHERERSKLERRDLALKLCLLQRLGLARLKVSELQLLELPLSWEQIEQIGRKLQREVLTNTLDRIFCRHLPHCPETQRLTLVALLLQDVESGLAAENCLRLLQSPVDRWPSIENSGYPLTEIVTIDDALKLAILSETACLELDPMAAADDPEPEAQLLKADMSLLVQQLLAEKEQTKIISGVLTDVMVDQVPKLNIARCRLIAGNYLSTLRDVALLGLAG